MLISFIHEIYACLGGKFLLYFVSFGYFWAGTEVNLMVALWINNKHVGRKDWPLADLAAGILLAKRSVANCRIFETNITLVSASMMVVVVVVVVVMVVAAAVAAAEAAAAVAV
jgi:hypothetical protein